MSRPWSATSSFNYSLENSVSFHQLILVTVCRTQRHAPMVGSLTAVPAFKRHSISSVAFTFQICLTLDTKESKLALVVLAPAAK